MIYHDSSLFVCLFFWFFFWWVAFLVVPKWFGLCGGFNCLSFVRRNITGNPWKPPIYVWNDKFSFEFKWALVNASDHGKEPQMDSF
jgi:hypothetical protein